MEDLSDYVIQFKSVLVVPEIGEAFLKFLEQEYSADNWNFVLQVNQLTELSKKKTHSKLIKAVKLISMTYLEPEAPKKIFVGKKLQKQILDQISTLDKKKWNLNCSAPELFEPLQKLILLEYKNDSFTRFSKDPACLKLIEKHKGNRNVLLPQLSMVYSYSDEDFSTRVFTKKDVEFLERFVQDNPNWQLVFSNKKTNTCAYRSTWNYFPNVSFLTDTYANTKNQIIFDYSLQEVACAVFSQYQHSDPHALEVKTVEYKPQTHVIFQQNSSMGPLTEPRTKRVIYTVDYNPEKKKLFVRGRPSKIENVPFLKSHLVDMVVKKGDPPVKTKAIQYFTYYTTILTALDDNRTLFEQYIAFDVGGVGFTNMMIEKRLLGMQANYLALLKNLGDRKKVKDFKYEFNDLWEGIPLQPLGKLIYDLDIDGQDEEYQKRMEKRKQVFDLSNFVVHFSAVNKRDIASLYYNFLKKECNTDSWDLIVDFLRLLKYNSKKKNVDGLLKEIIDTYFQKGGKKQILIQEKLLGELLESQSNPQKCIGILQGIVAGIKMEHQLDSFKRFIKSEGVSETLSQYQHDAEVMSPILNFVSIYKTDDFKDSQIIEKDIEFSVALAENASTWDQIYSTKNCTISVSKVNWFPNCSLNNSNIVSYETRYELNHPIEKVVAGYFVVSKFNKIDPNITKVKFIKENEETNENYASVVLGFDMVWLWKTSFLKENVCTFFIYDSDLYFICKPIQTKEDWYNKEGDQIHYFQYDIFVLSKKNEETTSFQHVTIINTNENIDWNQKIIERNKSFYPSLETSISSIKSCNFKEFGETKENGELKEPLGKLLMSIDFNKCDADDPTTETETESDVLTSTDELTGSRSSIAFDGFSPYDLDMLTETE